MLKISEIVKKTEAWLREALGEDGIRASRLPEEGGGKGGSKKFINRSIKYVCPECGIIIRATRESTWYVGIAAYHSSGRNKGVETKKAPAEAIPGRRFNVNMEGGANF